MENRPRITMVRKKNEEKKVVCQNKRPILHPQVNARKNNADKSLIPAAHQPRKVLPAPSIFCPICQTTDTRSATIKLHMESKREVQCKACKLYFGNCFSLGKHRKGRCRDKKAREENLANH